MLRMNQQQGSTDYRYTHIYNGDGLRVEVQQNTGTSLVRYVWDGQNVLAETDGSNATLAVYTLEPKPYGNLISQRR